MYVMHCTGQIVLHSLARFDDVFAELHDRTIGRFQSSHDMPNAKRRWRLEEREEIVLRQRFGSVRVANRCRRACD